MPPRMGLLIIRAGLATTMSLLTELKHGTLGSIRSPNGSPMPKGRAPASPIFISPKEFGARGSLPLRFEGDAWNSSLRIRFRDELILKSLIFGCLQQNIRCGWPKFKAAPLKIMTGGLKMIPRGL